MDLRLLDRFKDKSVLVLGDLMIDRYIHGHATRISPEAPVPVINVTREENVLGGAGNVANNLATLGAKVFVSGVIGADRESKILKDLLKERNIDFSLVIEDPNRPTTMKKRVISGNNYQMIRLDYEKVSDISKDDELIILEKVIPRLKVFDAIIISDYSKGAVTEYLTKKIIREASKLAKPTIVDVKHPKHMDFFKGCTLIKPNLKEATELTGIENDISKMGEKLVNLLGCNVFITRGSEGISVFDRGSHHTHVSPLHVTRVFDVTGAGDTVLAVAALAMCSGYDLVDSATLANFAAGIIVQKPGTAALTIDELRDCVTHELSHHTGV